MASSMIKWIKSLAQRLKIALGGGSWMRRRVELKVEGWDGDDGCGRRKRGSLEESVLSGEARSLDDGRSERAEAEVEVEVEVSRTASGGKLFGWWLR